MKNVKILDCTLRDGGRIIDCAFSDQEITQIVNKLAKAKVDIIEVGFLRDWRDVTYNGNSTFFTDVDQIVPLLGTKNPNITFTAFVDFGMFDFDSLKPYDGTSIDGIRVGFTKNDYITNYNEIVQSLKHVKDKGYKLFIQGVNSLNYTDKELLNIIDMVNEVQSAGYGVVDTYGAMYVDDVIRLYSLIDHNLDKNIAIDFHSHNNFQLSFSFAQEIVRLSRGVRNVIVDATLNGMGKEAGNLNTELIVDYLARKMGYDYDLDYILDAIDENLFELNQEHRWGYSPTSMMSGIYKSHPNNVIYLTQKFRLDTKDIKNLLFMLDEKERQTYNYDKIDILHENYSNTKYDDTLDIEKLQTMLTDKPVLIMASGRTITTHKEQIDDFVKTHNPFVIGVGFLPIYAGSIVFFANKKRYTPIQEQRDYKNMTAIVTSDIAQKHPNEIIVNYYSLLAHGHKWFNNSAIMLLNLLKKIEVKTIAVAGMDGFSKNSNENYFDAYRSTKRLESQYDEANREIADMLNNYKKTVSDKCSVLFITPTIYDNKLYLGGLL